MHPKRWILDVQEGHFGSTFFEFEDSLGSGGALATFGGSLGPGPQFSKKFEVNFDAPIAIQGTTWSPWDTIMPPMISLLKSFW